MSGALQLGFSDYAQVYAKKKTPRISLDEMEAIIPWEDFHALIRPVYHQPSAKGGRPPFPLEVMLRIHLLQQWFTLSDPLMEEMLIDTPCFRRFAGIDMVSERIPDETTILNFRYLLEEHGICLISEQLALPVVDDLEALSQPFRMRLEGLASQPRAKGKVERQVLIDVLLQLCEERCLTLRCLAELVHRKPDTLRDQYLKILVRQRQLNLAFPKTPNHERQAYTSAKPSTP